MAIERDTYDEGPESLFGALGMELTWAINQSIGPDAKEAFISGVKSA